MKKDSLLPSIGLRKVQQSTAVKSFTITPSSYKGGMGGNWLFDGQGNVITHFNYENINSAMRAYMECPPVTAIINRKAQAFINGKTFLINTKGQGKDKEATGPVAQKIKNLMRRPNPLQNWKQFLAQNYIYQQISGYCIVLPIKPVGFGNTDAIRLWNVPPYMVNIIEKPNVNLLTATSIKDFIWSVQLIWGGLVVNLSLEDIFIFKDFTVSASSFVFPESRIKSLERPVNNVIGAYESRNVLINRRGAIGILSNGSNDVIGTQPLEPTEKEAIQNEYRKFGLRHDQWQVIITSANLKWQQMGFATKDLMLFEEIEDDVMRMCDAYGYPYRLMSSEKSNSLGGNDVKTYTKILYQDSVMPEAENNDEQWNEFFGLEQYGLKYYNDYRHIHALQEDQLNEATALWRRNQGALIQFQNNLITLNQWIEINDGDPITADWGNKYYWELVAMGIQFGQGTAGSSVPDTSGQSDSGGNNNNDQNSNQNSGGNQ